MSHYGISLFFYYGVSFSYFASSSKRRLFPLPQNAVTHNSPSPKSKVMLEWESPSDFEGDVVFT